MSRWNKSSRQQRIEEERAAARAARAAATAARRHAAAQKRTPDAPKPQPDTTNRNQPCKKALAHKPHGAHRYRSGNQQMHCPGVQ